jgi:predicted unusual protein kinase regulating ubiquinone biosynthesis (AarF/ABC1/UbiB family)
VAPPEEELRRLDALLGVGLRLARSARSGRVAMARVASAIEPEWLPGPGGRAIADELLAAREEACQPIELSRVEQTLSAAWGGKPTDELSELEPEPIAVTPTAQVHRATLEEGGKAVAVKVLRPGLAAAVRQDLALLEGLVAPLNAAFPAVDAAAMLREVRERTLDELDLENEAATQRRVHRALRRHPFATVPAPVMRLCDDEVMVSEFLEGMPLWDASDPDQAAARLLVFAIGAARAGIVHADLHPDDVLVLADGRLAILDFGAVAEPDQDRLNLTADALEAFIAEDEAALGASLEQLGWLPAHQAGTAMSLAAEVLAELAGPEPVRLDSEAVVAVRDRAMARPEAVLELLLSGRLAPEDLWPARGLGALFGTIARVGATGAWRELARAALREGWEAELG